MTNDIKIDNLNFGYGENIIFSNLSFFIQKKSYNIVLGSNKCGKTTLFNILANNIHIDDENVCTYNTNNVGLYNSKSCKYNNKLTVSKYLLSVNDLNYNLFKSVISFFDIKSILYNKMNSLSEYDTTKVIISYLILNNKTVLLLDDIYDCFLYDEFISLSNLLLLAIEKYNLTIIVSSSKLDYCLGCNNILFISEKKILLNGNFEYMLDHDNILVRNGIVISEMLDLSLKLKMYNIIDNIVYNPRKLVELLWK